MSTKIVRKPFNLTEALAGKPVVNGEGTPVTNLTLLPLVDRRYKLVGVVKGEMQTYTEQGLWSLSLSTVVWSWANLYMAESVEERTGYINVWENADQYSPVYASFHYSLAQAEAERTSSCSNKKKVLLARIPFSYTYNQDTREIKINA